jgi:hypothetical protein
MGDPCRAFRQHHPVPAGKHPRRTTTPCGTVTARPAGRATSSGQPRYRGQAAAAGPATPANTRARASPRHHHPSRRHKPSHDNRQHILLVPMMSRHGHRRLLHVAPPCLLAVPTPPAAGITHPEATASRRSAAGPAPRSPAVTPHRRRAPGGITGPTIGPRVPSGPHNCRSRAAPAATPTDRNRCHKAAQRAFSLTFSITQRDAPPDAAGAASLSRWS